MHVENKEKRSIVRKPEAAINPKIFLNIIQN